MQLLSSIGELDGDDASLRALANDLATVSQGAWANLPTSRVTFDELQTTGSLGLIRPVELRQQVAAYYQDFDLRIQRLDERITDFPRLAYGLVRREGEFEAAELTSQELRRLRQGVSTPGFAAALTAELNRTKTQTSNYDELYAEAVQLLKDLDTYLLAL